MLLRTCLNSVTNLLPVQVTGGSGRYLNLSLSCLWRTGWSQKKHFCIKSCFCHMELDILGFNLKLFYLQLCLSLASTAPSYNFAKQISSWFLCLRPRALLQMLRRCFLRLITLSHACIKRHINPI
jgi:hypothetical protein